VDSLRDRRAVAAKFDRLALGWDDFVVGCRYEHVFHWLARCAKHLPTDIMEGGRVTDLACGVGLMGQTLRLLGFGGQLRGVDISPGMLQMARRRRCYDSLVCASVESPVDLPPDADVVLCTGALEILDIPKVLSEARRLCRAPGAQLWATFQHDDGTAPTAHQGVAGITLPTACDLLRQAGFVVTHSETATAFYTPYNGELLPVPYIFVTATATL